LESKNKSKKENRRNSAKAAKRVNSVCAEFDKKKFKAPFKFQSDK
jgi:hypothetical protein